MIPVYNSFDYFQNLLPLALVVGIVLHFVKHGASRRAIFIVCGVYALALVAPRLALYYVAYWLLTFVLHRAVAAAAGARSGLIVLWGAIVVLVAPLLLWKAMPEAFVVDFNVWTNQAFRASSSRLAVLDLSFVIIAPVGLSFATFRALDLVVKTYVGLVGRLSIGRVMAYGTFAPLLVVGPIAEYKEIEATLDARVPIDTRRATTSLLLLCSGLVKVFVGSVPLQWSIDIFQVWQYNSAWQLLYGLVAYTWFFYLNFAGFSDLAIAAGHWFGASLHPNFNAPYLKTSPTTFWNSWHISLTSFVRRNVFVPLGGFRTERFQIATVATMMVIALWHGFTWASVVFGLYHSAALLAHRRLQAARPARPGRWRSIAKSVGVFCWFGLSLPLLTLPLGDCPSFYRALLLGGRLA